MTTMPSFAASSASASPTRTLRSSDSTTQGPAMRNGADPPPNFGAMSVGQLGELGGRARGRAAATNALLVLQRGAHEAREQRVGAHRPRLELRVELAADEPRVIGQLDHLDERAVRRQPRATHPELGEDIAVRIGDLVAVAVSLAHFARAVHLGHARPGAQPAGIGAEPHGAAHLLDAFLRAHQGYDRVLTLGLELARIGVGDLADVAGEFDDRGLQPEADAEERQLGLARPTDRLEPPFAPPHPQAAGCPQLVG